MQQVKLIPNQDRQFTAPTSAPRRVVRILTDAWIEQSPHWQVSTDCIRIRSGGGIWAAFRSLLELLRRCRHYDVVITSNLRTGMLFGAFRRLWPRERPRHIVLELMLDEEGNSLGWKLKRAFQAFAYSKVDIIFVSARGEIDCYAQRLGLSRTKFRFLPFHTNVITPQREPPTGGYIFSAGRSGRDYATLAEAVKHVDCPVVVVSDAESVRGLVFSDNVTVLTDIPYDKYRELLAKARIVVVPLHEHIFSSGQVVILEGMALGKPVITNATTGTIDYVTNGQDGILVARRDPALFRDAIQRILDDPALENDLSHGALETILKQHTFDHYVDAILNAVTELEPASHL